MAGLSILKPMHNLKHMHNLSDEELTAGWVENPYYQLFCGEEFFPHKAPQVQISDLIAVALDRAAQIVSHRAIRVQVEQHRARVADEADRPVRDGQRADNADRGVHPRPAEQPSKGKADNDGDRNGRVSCHMDDCGAHVVVARRRAMRMLVLPEHDRAGFAVDRDVGRERVGLG